MHRPFVILFQQDSAHEAEDGGFVGEVSDHIGARLDLAIETLDGIVGLDLRARQSEDENTLGARMAEIVEAAAKTKTEPLSPPGRG